MSERGTRAVDHLHTIEWDMLDKRKLIPLNILNSAALYSVMYPLGLIKTRLQNQLGSSAYRGTWDAGRQILRTSGVRGLYRGYWVGSPVIAVNSIYVTTYENSRYLLDEYGVKHAKVKAFLAGGFAALVCQGIQVPVEITCQHLMVQGHQAHPSAPKEMQINPQGQNKALVSVEIIKKVYQLDGLRGFYRGFSVSVLNNVPNAALWWGFYQFYQDRFLQFVPEWFSHLAVQCSAGICAGTSASVIMNPVDLLRSRVQVHRMPSISKTAVTLWHEEKLKIFAKGLSARLMQSVAFSFCIILGYESLKRISVREEYKDKIKW